jgi:hypothetical protein
MSTENTPALSGLEKTIADAVLPYLAGRIKAGVNRAEVERIATEVAKREGSPVTRIEILNPRMPEPKDMGVQHKQFRDLLSLVGPGDHVWISGEAGTGKTHAAEACAHALGLPFAYTGAVADKYEFSGFRDAHGVYHGTALRQAWEHGGFWVHDEADRSDNAALLALNACLANGVAAFPDGMVKRHPDCRVIVTANTVGNGPDAKYVGAARIDKAFRNRFFLLRWELDQALEIATTPWEEWTREVQAARAWAASRGMRDVMITPRESYRGPRALARGARLEVVRRATWGADLTDEQFRDAAQVVAKIDEVDVRTWRDALPKADAAKVAS